MNRTQAHCPLEFVSPLGKDALLLRSIHGHERLGRLFSYEVDLVSEREQVASDKLLGCDVLVRVTPPNTAARTISAVVSSLERFPKSFNDQNGKRVWRVRATLAPWFWLLSRTSDCRIFQHLSVPQIIKQVVGDFGFDGVLDLRLTSRYRPRTYCVQYRESAFNFLSRLMEDEGMYYFFEQRDNRHYMVVCDAPGSHAPCPGIGVIPFRPDSLNAAGFQERVWDWASREEVRSSEYQCTDFDFRRPSKVLLTGRKAEHRVSPIPLEVYDYPGGYIDREFGHDHWATVRRDELLSQRVRFHGRTNSPGVCVGGFLTLDQDPLSHQGKPQYLVTACSMSAHNPEFNSSQSADDSDIFEQTFETIPASAQFRAERSTPKPVVRGSQTAIVTGPAGQEVYIDRHARVKVHFHWDRRQAMDQRSSCWVRVNQPWAGKGFGGLNLPRIGQEVIVDFLEGDPDQPLITGRLYNGESPPPVSKAGKDVQSAAASKPKPAAPDPAPQVSGKAGSPRLGDASMVDGGAHPRALGGGFNAASATGGAMGLPGYSQASSENHAPAALGAEGGVMSAFTGSHAITSGASSTSDADPDDQALGPGAMEAYMMTTLKSNSLGGSGGSNEITMDDTGGNEKMFMHAQFDEVHTVGNNRLDQVGVDEVLSVGNNKTEDIGVNATETVGTAKVVDVGSTILIKAGTSITLQCGASMIHMNQAGFITIKGMVISVLGGANCSMTAPVTNVTGGVLLTNTGTVNLMVGAVCRTQAGTLASINSGGQAEVVAGADAVVQGAAVKLN